MKRSVPQDFNLVYPYKAKRPNIMPPFFDRNGFVENQEATLAMLVEKPLTFDKEGALTLGVGRGIRINPAGLLETNDLASAVFPPLASDEAGNVTLNMSDGLYTKDNKLAVKVGPGLSLDSNNALQVHTGDGLTVTDDKVSLNTQAPLSTTSAGLSLLLGPSLHLGEEERLTVNTGAGLQISNNALAVKVGSGITVDAQNQLAASLGDGLESRDNKTVVKAGPGLTITNQALTVATGNGLQVNPEGQLQLNITAGQGLNFANNSLAVELGSGLHFPPGQNQVSLYPGDGIDIRDNRVTVPAGPGLRMLNHQLAVASGDGLEVHSDTLRLKLSHGLTFENGAVRAKLGPGLGTDDSGRSVVRTGRGLRVANGQVQIFSGRGTAIGTDSSLTLNIRAPLQFSGPALTASLQGSGPITYNSNNGTFGLSIGPGMWVDQNRLQVNPGAGLVFQGNNLVPNLADPLAISDSKISLSLGPGLTQASNALTLSLGNGLEFSNQAVAIKAGRGLRFESSSQALESSLTVGNGLTLTDTVIRPNLGDGLEVRDNKIIVKLGANLRFENGAVTAGTVNPSAPEAPPTLTAEPPLRASNSHLQLSLSEGLVVHNNALALQLGDGMEVNQHGLTLRVGSGLQMRDGILTVTPSGTPIEPRLTAPLTQTENGIGLALGAGLELDESALQVKVGPGMRLNPVEKYVTLLLGPGLSFGQPANRTNYDVRVSVEPPMVFGQRGQLTFLVGHGLHIQNSKLQLNLGQGLRTDPVTNQLEVPLGQGLEIADESQVRVKLGDGLQFDSQARITTAPNMVTETLWTGTGSNANVTWRGYTAPGSKLFLSLTRFSTGLVLGNMTIDSNASFGQYINAGHEQIECFILLDNQGNLKEGSNLQGTWEVKNNPSASKAAFLPSTALYPILNESRGSLPGKNLVGMQAILGGGGTCTVIATLNGRRSNNYPAGQSIIFVWQEFNTIARQPLNHSTLTFSYWT
ncbi:fiber protein [Bovine adenovirus 3]|uniref:Fiber protein n=2 Tax=Bovine adenovirus B serotype 3 TaxID=10510 RepID=SPIKE_ADEB3|nr:fiber protein [Bovine adenovirus 3]AP_000041.1 fiber [Bovine mastadenovirus B]Q03553.2 RecName: Full=Fiber protein; Short=SPIKE; AltName: Full=Protein IV [Bovine adenovirus 3]AAD09736.1 fiber protein [Bovine adenovirus 3]BAA04115.1 fiber protein [Bovine adenovirus 3]